MKRFAIAVLLTFSLQQGIAKTLRVPADYPSIQAAINAAGIGDRVVVAPGTYRERLLLKPQITVVSEGDEIPTRAARTIIDGGGSNINVPGVSMAEASTLDGFTITGVGTFDPALWQRHWDERGENQSHASIGGFGVPAIAVDGVSCRIQNCIVRDNGHTGIALRGNPEKAVHPMVLGNRCFRNMGGGIGIMEGAGGIVQGNECYENFWAGIGHGSGAAPLVLDNDCHDNVRAGIGISEGASPVVRGNRCHKNRRAGIGIRTGATTRPVVEDNDCFENGMAGIGIEDKAEPVIRGNRCERNEAAGIGADHGARPLLVANICRENGASGIGLNADCEAIIWRNTCEANKAVAIGLPRNSRAVIADNQLSREGGLPPLVAIRGGSEAILTGNRLEGGGVAGVLIEGKAILAGNSISSSKAGSSQGIWLWKGSSALGAENVITGFKTSLSLAEDAEWIGERP